MSGGLDVGTVTGNVKINFDSGGINEAVAGLNKVAETLTRTGERSKQSGTAIEADIARVNESYRKLAASLDPVVAGQKRYEDAHITLDAALKRGLISHAQYEQALDKAKEKFLAAGGGLTQFQTLLGKLTELTNVAGPAASEAAEKLGLLGEKAAGVTELVTSLGPLAPILITVAAAVAAIGLAWKAFELSFDFLRDAIKEGADFEQTVAKLNNTLIANGSASGLSAHQMIEFAESLSIATARPTAEITKGLAVLAQFQKVGHETFERASRDILDYAQQVGTSPEEAFQKFGRALEGGQRGLRALEEVGGVFLKSQKDTLRQMLDNGDVIGYQTLLLKILEEHVKGAAEAYGRTFHGQVAQAKNALTDFKEGIANQVLPAIEDLVNDLVGSQGGWEAIRSGAKGLGNYIGEIIRTIIYNITLWYHEWEALSWKTTAEVQAAIGTLVGGALDGLAKLFTYLGRIPGTYGVVFSTLATEAKSVADQVTDHFAKSSGEAMRNFGQETLAISVLTAQYKIHRTALEGDTEVQGKHASTIDDVAKKEKELARVYEALAKAIQAYDDKLDDQTRKLQLTRDAKESLLAAAQAGLYEYAVEVDAQARLAAVTAQTTALDKEHRTEIEALTQAEQKLRDLHKTSEANAVAAEIDALNKKYVEQRAEIASLANANYTLETAIKRTSGARNEEKSLLDAVSISQAKLLDAANGNTDATRKLSLELATEKDRLALLPPVLREYFAALRQTADETDHLATTQKTLTGLSQTSAFQNAVAQINTDLPANLQAVEEKYLEFLRTAGQGSIDEGKRRLQELSDAERKRYGDAGRTLEEIIAQIKNDLAGVADAAAAARIRGAGKSNLQVYQEQQDQIDRLITEGLVSEKDGAAASTQLQEQFWSNTVSTWSSALQTLGGAVGGFVAKLAQAAQALQTSQSVSSGISSGVSSLGGSGALSSGLGAIAGEVYLVYAIKSFFEAQWAEEASRRFGSVGEFIISNGKEWITQLDQNGAESIKAIRQVVENFGQAIGGTVTDIAKIGIQVRNDGKAFIAYVEDKFLGYFTSASEAIKAAVLYALQDPKSSIRGISELVRQGLANYRSSATDDLDALTQLLTKLREISDLGKSSDQSGAEAALKNVDGLRDALLKLHDVTPAVIQGFIDIAKSGDDIFAKWRDSITGTQRTAYETFEQSKLAYNAERDSREAALKAQIEETKARLLAAGVTVQTTQQVLGALQSISAASNVLPGNEGNVGGARNFNYGNGPTGPNGGGLNQGGGTFDGGGPPIASGGPNVNKSTAETDALKALLDSLLRELADLPAKITEADFRNPNAANFYSRQIDDAVESFKRVANALAAANETADQFSSDLSSALSNVAQSFLDTRDAITGHTRSAAEELAVKQQQAALFNAELPLEIANLKAEVAKDQALLASAGITNTYAAVVLDSAKAIAANAQITAQATVLTGQLSAAEIEATQRKIDALNGVIQVLEQIKPINISEIRVSGGTSGGKSPAQQLADFFAAFERSQLPALSATISDINKKYDDEIKATHATGDNLKKLNAERQIEIDKAKEQARQAQVSSAQSFIDATLPDLVKQINGVHTGAQGLIDGLRSLAAQGGLSTAELHRLVGALREAEAAQVAAIKTGVLDQINQFAATLGNQGLAGQLANIATQAQKLRDSLNQLAQAGTLTADEFFTAAGKLTAAAKAQEQAAFESSATTLLDQLYGYLHEDARAQQLKFNLTVASLKLQEAQLEEAVKVYGLVGDYIPEIKDLIARVEAAGPGIFASGGTGTGPNPANALADYAAKQGDAASTLQSAADSFAASTQKLIDYQKSLTINSALSPLTPSQQRDEALAQLQAVFSQALGGSIDARNNFSQSADAFLKLARSVDPSSLGYGVDFKLVQDMLARLIGQTTYTVPGTTNVTAGAFGSPSGSAGAGAYATSNPTSFAAAAPAIDLSPVVVSIQSGSNRNHDDLGALTAKVDQMRTTIANQQGRLDRLVSLLERRAAA